MCRASHTRIPWYCKLFLYLAVCLDSSLLTHKKNNNVTIVKGHKLCLRVRLAALVTWLLFTLKLERFLRIFLTPIITAAVFTFK